MYVVRMCVGMYIMYIYVCTYMYICTYAYVCMYERMNVCMYEYINAYM